MPTRSRSLERAEQPTRRVTVMTTRYYRQAEGADNRRFRLRWRRRHPGRPQDLCRARGLRHLRHHRAHRPEHGRRHGRARDSGRIRHRADRSRGQRHRLRRGEDRDARHLRHRRGGGGAVEALELPNLVVDPVMVAKSGDRLLDDDAVHALRATLLRLARVVTPNIPEAEVLTGMAIGSREAMREAAHRLARPWAAAPCCSRAAT